MGSAGTLHWFLNRAPVISADGSWETTIPMPPPGSYQLAAVDETGNFDTIEIQGDFF